MDPFQMPGGHLEKPIVDVAQQLLLRRPESWDGFAARRLVCLALSRSSTRLPEKAFRSLVSAAFRVGREMESAGILCRELEWPIEDLCQGIDGAIPPGLPDADRECLSWNLASKLKGFEPDRPIMKDWVELVTRASRQENLADAALDLDQKCAIAIQLAAIYEARLGKLVQLAEEILDVSLEDVTASLTAVVAARAAVGPESDRDPEYRPTVRLDETEIARLAGLAGSSHRESFDEWIRHLQPVAQRAVQRRLSGLIEASPLCRMWVKPILGHHHGGLKELRVVADRVHYRILFSENAARLIRVWAFGFRRDLDELIRSVCID